MTVRVSKPEFNLREKLTELDKPTGLKGLDLMRSDTTQDSRDNISAGRKNYIINGDFQISQRADYTSATTAANQVYYLDRCTVDLSGVSGTIPSGSGKFELYPFDGAGGSHTGGRYIENNTNSDG